MDDIIYCDPVPIEGIAKIQMDYNGYKSEYISMNPW